MKSNKEFIFIIFLVLGIFFTCTILFYANKTHTAAKSKAPSIAVAEVEIDVPIEVGSSSPIQAEMTDISFDGVERNVLSNTATVVLHNDSDSADHQWDNIASIGANGKNAVPIGGSKDIKTPWNSSAPVVKPVVGHCVPRRVQFIIGGADFFNDLLADDSP